MPTTNEDALPAAPMSADHACPGTDLRLDALMYITDRPPPVFVRGDGSWLWDHQGKAYLDFVQGWAVNCLGHCPDEVRFALSRQAARLINPSPAYYNEPSARLAARLCELSDFDRVFFASSGAEANEGAIKLARRWGQEFRDGAFEVISFENAFHGRTLATMSASGKPAFASLFEPKVPGFQKARLNDIESVRALVGARTVAVMIEPIQGEAGVIEASPDFMHALRTLTTEHGLLLIVDEIQSGMGRSGLLWAYQYAGIRPDIMTLGKGIGGGVPLAAMLATQAVSCFQPGDQGGTYCGNPLMSAVGLSVLEAIAAPGFLENVRARSSRMLAGLGVLSARHGLGPLRGRGLLTAVALPRPIGSQLVAAAHELGLLLNAPRPDTIRLMPSLVVSDAEIDLMIERFDQAWRHCVE